jgi:ComF family protein
MKPYEGLKCRRCEKPLQSDNADGCRECKERDNYFSYMRSAGVYKGGLKELIHYMKFNNKKSVAKVAARLMIERITPEVFADIDYIVPAPMSRGSFAERGYNQTAVVAGYISKAKAIPVKNAVIKIRDTPPQNSLDRHDRLKNLKGAFKVDGYVRDKRFLIVDDVFTTGSTVNEAAKVLIEAGAMEVRGAVIARSI